MNAHGLFKQGKLDEAIETLGVELRDNPTDAQRRAFLFELLCFAGSYDRAEKQLGVLGRNGKDAELGVLLYYAALHAERIRQDMFEKESFPLSSARVVGGTLNGKPFDTMTDADPRIGPRLELFAAGQYSWMPFEHIATIRIEAPKRLRDLLWIPAIVRPNDSFRGLEMGEVLLPVIAPQSSQFDDADIRLGRVTEFNRLDDGTEVPVGQKILLVDGEEFPMLELRELEFAVAPAPVA